MAMKHERTDENCCCVEYGSLLARAYDIYVS